MDQTQDSQRTPYLVVPHSARSPAENKQSTRGNVLSLWCSLYRPRCPPSQRAFNERQHGHRRSCEQRAANSIDLTKPLNEPAQSSRDSERPKTGGVAAVGVCPDEGGRGPSVGTLCDVSWFTESFVGASQQRQRTQSSLFLKNGANTHPRCFLKANTILFPLFGQMGRDLWSVHVRTRQRIFQMCD